LGLADATTTEANPNTPNPVIAMMESQKNIENKGGTMRLGAYNCELKKVSLAYSAYGQKMIAERHRHRYEFNNYYLEAFKKAGMIPTGINPDTGLVEIVEIKNHRYFIGVQFHPELKSTVLNPHPLFVRFVKEAILYKAENEK
jgi:CTP synthase